MAITNLLGVSGRNAWLEVWVALSVLSLLLTYEVPSLPASPVFRGLGHRCLTVTVF